MQNMTAEQYLQWLVERTHDIERDQIMIIRDGGGFGYSDIGIPLGPKRKAYARVFAKPKEGPDGPIYYELISEPAQ